MSTTTTDPRRLAARVAARLERLRYDVAGVRRELQETRAEIENGRHE